VPVLIIDAASFFICAFCMGQIKVPTRPAEEGARGGQAAATAENGAEGSFVRSLLRDLKSGYVYLFTKPLILWVMVFSFFFNMAYGPIEAGLPIYATEELQNGGLGLGLLLSALAVGSLLGSLIFSVANWTIPAGYTLAGIIVLWGITTLPLAFSDNMMLAMLSMGLAGVAFAPFNIIYRSYLQRNVPEHLLGRVFTSIRTVTGLGMPLGAFITGLTVPLLGIYGLFLAASILCVAAGLVAFLMLKPIR
jgi:MFS family permease